jgi:hypothetical protein
MDAREQILTRLVDIASDVPDIVSVRRNRVNISETSRPAIIVLDADEAVEEEPGARSVSLPMLRTSRPVEGRPAFAPQFVTMAPEIYVLISSAAAEIGAQLNMFRRRLIRRVLFDALLTEIVGSSGSIRYAGCATALAVGRSMEGEMAVSFSIRYVLNHTDLED